MVHQMTGWQIEINGSPNMMALHSLAKKLLGANLIGRASIFMPERAVEVRVKNLPENWKDLQEQFRAETGFRLLSKGGLVKSYAPAAPATPQDDYLSADPQTEVQPLEINEAYAILKLALRDLGLYKVGLKGTGIVLSFITPEQGGQHFAKIQELSDRVGYTLSIHPHPNQHSIIMLIGGMCEERGIYLVKNPSLQVAEQKVILEPNDPITDEVMAELLEEFFAKTAWQLEFKAPMF